MKKFFFNIKLLIFSTGLVIAPQLRTMYIVPELRTSASDRVTEFWNKYPNIHKLQDNHAMMSLPRKELRRIITDAKNELSTLSLSDYQYFENSPETTQEDFKKFKDEFSATIRALEILSRFKA